MQNKRNGSGIVYDSDGKELVSGVWENDRQVHSNSLGWFLISNKKKF
jgi:hypothetical protein